MSSIMPVGFIFVLLVKTIKNMIREPENSWEVSYVFLLKGLKGNTDVSLYNLRQVLSWERKDQLQVWAEQHLTPKWVYEHTLA